MIQTGQFLQKHNLKKTIIITGAMRPAKFKDSDAELNIGAALALVQSLDHGVYIVMHGIFGEADKITRDENKGKFIAK
jgi:L-asparaginase